MTTMTAAPDATTTQEDKPPRSKKKKLILVVLVLALLGGGYWFVLRDSGPAAPEPGEVLVLDPIQLNLEGGHYLRVGLALQLTTTAHELDGSKALDAVIELFSGRRVEEVTKPAGRNKLKKELTHQLEESYHGDVMGVYFTEFVTQ